MENGVTDNAPDRDPEKEAEEACWTGEGDPDLVGAVVVVTPAGNLVDAHWPHVEDITKDGGRGGSVRWCPAQRTCTGRTRPPGRQGY